MGAIIEPKEAIADFGHLRTRGKGVKSLPNFADVFKGLPHIFLWKIRICVCSEEFLVADSL